MFPPLMTCQGWVSSNHRMVLVGVVNCTPLASFTCQRHQTVVPGASEPDWTISQVHSTFTSDEGVTSGKALASTVPQVSWLTPYSSTTELMVPPERNSAL